MPSSSYFTRSEACVISCVFLVSTETANPLVLGKYYKLLELFAELPEYVIEQLTFEEAIDTGDMGKVYIILVLGMSAV